MKQAGGDRARPGPAKTSQGRVPRRRHGAAPVDAPLSDLRLHRNSVRYADHDLQVRGCRDALRSAPRRQGRIFHDREADARVLQGVEPPRPAVDRDRQDLPRTYEGPRLEALPFFVCGRVFPYFSLVSVKRLAEAMEIDVDSEQGCG